MTHRARAGQRTSSSSSTPANKPSAARGTAASSRTRPVRRAPSRAELAGAFALPPAAPRRISADFADAFQRSPLEAVKVANGVLRAPKPIAELAVDSGELVQSAALSRSMDQRRALIKAFRQSKQDLMFIHHLTELPADQTAEFIKDYFDEGGTEASVAEWLQLVGRALREVRGEVPAPRPAPRVLPSASGQQPRGLAGGWFDDAWDWVKDTVKKAGEAIVDAVTSVVDAVVKAGKSIASAVAAAVNWTVDQVTDLVEALVKAGRKVADILSAAVAKGVAQLQKFVQAVLAAGRQVVEVLSWAASQAAATMTAVVQKLLALGRKVVDVVKAVASAAAATVNAVIKGLLAAGKAVAELLAAVANEAASFVKNVVGALLAAGKAIKDILVDAAKQAAAALRNVVSALLNLGRSLAEIMADAVKLVATSLNAVVQAVLALGRTVLQVVQSVANAVQATVSAVVKALMAAGKAVVDLANAAIGMVSSAAAKVFKAIIAAGKKVADILVAVAGRAVSALRTAVEALLQMGLSLAEVVKDIVVSVAEGFRRGFFEGLIALGKAPLLILKAAAEAGVSVLLLAVGAIFEICGGHRGLTAAEIAEARKVFGSSIDLTRVKIATASIPADILNWINGDRPFTTMYIINFGRNAVIDMATLIHELTHVWQGVQTGPLYMTRALTSQIGAGLDNLFHEGHYDDDEAYAVTDEELVQNGGDLSKFNPEEQASIVEHYWIQKFSGSPQASLPTVAQLEPYALDVFKPLSPKAPVIPRPSIPVPGGRRVARGARPEAELVAAADGAAKRRRAPSRAKALAAA